MNSFNIMISHSKMEQRLPLHIQLKLGLLSMDCHRLARKGASETNDADNIETTILICIS